MPKKGISKSLKAAIWDGSSFSVMQNIADTFLIPFALALNATNVQVGLVRAVPQLMSAFSQFIAVKLVDGIKQRKKIIFTFAFLQGLMWLPLFILPFLLKGTALSVPMLIIAIGLFSTFGSIITPAWWSLIGDHVPEEIRGRYFGMRNKISGIFGITATFIAGYILDIFSKTNVFLGFGILFVAAFIARLFSCYFLSRIEDIRYSVKHESQFNFKQFMEKLRFTNFGRYTIFFSLMMLVVNFAGPFFTVYMLKELNLSYVMFTALVLAQSVVYFISMTYWGRSGDRYGDKHVMTICGFLIPFVPILWMLSSNLYYLFTIQIFSGFVWAGFDLSASNFIFDTVSPPKRARVVAYYNVIIGVATFLGATLGGLSATYLKPIMLLGSIKTIFLISAIGRFAVAAMFLPKLEEARSKVSVPEKRLFLRLIFVKPFRMLVHETNHDINWAMSHARMVEKKASLLFRR